MAISVSDRSGRSTRPRGLEVRIPANLPDEALMLRLGGLVRYVLFLVFAVAAGTLLLWLIPAAGDRGPAGWQFMKPNTALGILLMLAGLLLCAPRRSPQQMRLGASCFAGVLLLGALSLVEYGGLRIPGFDDLLAVGRNVAKSGPMSWQAAAEFCLFGIAGLLLRERSSVASLFADLSTLGALAIVMMVFSGYLFDATHLFAMSPQNLLAPQTLLCFVLLVVAMASRRAESGLLTVFVGIGIGSRIARVLLPLSISLPFLIAVSRGYVISTGLATVPYANAIASSAESFGVLCVVLWMAWRINQLERDLRELSLLDELTQLHNRRGFYLLGEQALRSARRSDSALTALFCDVDGLKYINDTFGHDAGSRLIAEAARLLRETFGGSDIVGRVGGDEFAVISADDASTMQQRLAMLEERIHQRNAGVDAYRLSISTGIAQRSASCDDFEQLLREADERMYVSKLGKQAYRERTLPASRVTAA